MSGDSNLCSYTSRCRCCLEDCEGDTYLQINKFIEERFFDFTKFNLTSSDKLSVKICTTCNSLLARYSAMKKTFIENQTKLENLLDQATETVYEVFHEENAGVKAAKGTYTFIESIEPFEEHLEPNRASNQTRIKLKAEEQIVGSNIETTNRRPAQKESLVCEFCSKQFQMRSTFNKHLARHLNYAKFICDKCGSRSHSRDDLLKHLFTHLKGDPRVIYKCDYEGCKSVYRNKKSLTHHKKNFHLKQRPFSCNLCPKTFTFRWMLTDHIKFTHQGLRPIPCDVKGCEACFTVKQHLKRHKRNVHKMTI